MESMIEKKRKEKKRKGRKKERNCELNFTKE